MLKPSDPPIQFIVKKPEPIWIENIDFQTPRSDLLAWGCAAVVIKILPDINMFIEPDMALHGCNNRFNNSLAVQGK